MSRQAQQKEAHRDSNGEIVPTTWTVLRCLFLEKAWHLMNSLYALVSQKVNTEEKCYSGLILAGKEVVVHAEVTGTLGESDRCP